MSESISVINKAKRLQHVINLVLIPFFIETALLLAAATAWLLSASWIKTVFDVIVVFSILLFLGSLLLAITSTAREDAAQSFTHGAIIRLPASIDEQLELRRAAIRSEGRTWGLSVLLLGESVALSVMNIIVMLSPRVVIILALLISLGMLGILAYKKYQLSLLTMRPSEKTSNERRNLHPVNELPERLKLGFDFIRIMKLIGIMFASVNSFIAVVLICEYIGIDIPGVYVDKPLTSGSLIAFLAVVLFNVLFVLFQLSVLILIAIILFVIGYEFLMMKMRCPLVDFKFRKGVIIHSIINSSIVLMLMDIILRLIVQTLPSTFEELLQLILELLVLLACGIVTGILLGWVWWNDVRQQAGVLALQRRKRASLSSRQGDIGR